MTLKLEVGKTYLNKKGEEVSIVGISPYDNGYQIFVGMDKNEESSTYCTNGEYYNGGGYYDLIAEHKQPVVHDLGWLVYLKKGDKVFVEVFNHEPILFTDYVTGTVMDFEKITYEEK